MLGGRKPEAEVVVAVVGVVAVTVGRSTVPRVIVPTTTMVHTVRVTGLIAGPCSVHFPWLRPIHLAIKVLNWLITRTQTARGSRAFAPRTRAPHGTPLPSLALRAFTGS